MKLDEKVIQKLVVEVINKLDAYQDQPYVPIGISNRHIHLSTKDLEVLFGKGYELTKLKDLKQPGQYAANETVTIIGPRGSFDKVRILGPVRKETQVELSVSDGFKLGINPPIRESGKIAETPSFIIEGPKGAVEKNQGAIAALRHIHMPSDYANRFGFKDKEMVKVEVAGLRKTTYHNVLLRVSDQFELEMHLDMDEANSGGVSNGDLGKIVKD